MKDGKRHIFGLDFSTDANNWMKILKRSKQTFFEISRTEDVKLRKNTDKLIWYYRNQQAEEVIKFCKSEFEIFSLAIRIDKSKPELFLKVMTNAHLNTFDVDLTEQILDAIQSHRPFYEELFKIVFETKHELWMNLMKAFYNKRYRELTVVFDLPGYDRTSDHRSHPETKKKVS